jgi:hypothetical protein
MSPETKFTIDEYFSKKKLPNSFLLAVLCNDLVAVINRGDEEALKELPAIVKYLKNNHSADAWGSVERVTSWTGKAILRWEL